MQSWTLITGSAKRLGASLARYLAEKGYPIVIHYHRSEKEALRVRDECRLLGVSAEVIFGNFSTKESTLDFAQRYKEIFPQTKNVIHNVGNYLAKPALKTSFEEWESLFFNNLYVPVLLTKAFLPLLIQEQGQIIHLGLAGVQCSRAHRQATVYSLAKGSLLSWTRALARELAPQKVRVNMVSPGYLDNAVDLPEDLKKLPMARAATCEEIGRMIAFLLDEKNEYMTGQNIEIAGGIGL